MCRSPAVSVTKPKRSPEYSIRGYLTNFYNSAGLTYPGVPAGGLTALLHPRHQQGRDEGRPNNDSARTAKSFPPPHRHSLCQVRHRDPYSTIFYQHFPRLARGSGRILPPFHYYLEMLRILRALGDGSHMYRTVKSAKTVDKSPRCNGLP